MARGGQQPPPPTHRHPSASPAPSPGVFPITSPLPAGSPFTEPSPLGGSPRPRPYLDPHGSSPNLSTFFPQQPPSYISFKDCGLTPFPPLSQLKNLTSCAATAHCQGPAALACCPPCSGSWAVSLRGGSRSTSRVSSTSPTWTRGSLA